MKIEVNGKDYDVELMGNKAIVNKKEIPLKLDEDEITILERKEDFHLDFIEEGEPIFMIINGMVYNVSKSISAVTPIKELKAPMSGQIIEVSARSGKEVKKGELVIVLEAMKMENHISSPIKGKIKEIKVMKGQSVKLGDVLLTFE